MRSLPLTLLAVASLLAPAAALASPGSSADTTRYFEIRGLVLGNVRTEAPGKIGIQGDQLSASAGCNMIGGTVRVDGNTVTIVGPTFMTEMACPGTDGDAEATLIKILELGTFTITADAWIADGGRIVTVEMTPPNPGPAGSPPDEPVGSSPGAVIIEPAPSDVPAQSCPPVPIDNGPGAISGSGSGGSSGSGGGSTGTGVATPGTAGSEPGSAGEPGSLPGATAVAPGGPEIRPDETSSAVEPVLPPPDGAVDSDPLIGSDPNVGKPVGNPCLEGAAYAIVPDTNAAPKDGAGAEMAARDASATNALVVPVVVGLGLAFLVAGGLYWRRRATRP